MAPVFHIWNDAQSRIFPELRTTQLSCAKNHDIERRRAVVKLPRAREKEREEDTVCSVVHIIFSRDVITEIHTRETSVSYVTQSYRRRRRGKTWKIVAYKVLCF